MYSRANCLNEFLAKFVYEKCNCTFFAMTPIYGDAPICIPSKHEYCFSTQLSAEYNKGTKDVCFESCWELSYQSTLSFARLKNNSILTNITNLKGNEMAVLSVLVPNRSFRGFRKRKLITFTDFLCKFYRIISYI